MIIPIKSTNIINRFKNSDNILANTKICFGAGVLCKILLFPLKATIDALTDDEKNWNRHHPHKKYTG